MGISKLKPITMVQLVRLLVDSSTPNLSVKLNPSPHFDLGTYGWTYAIDFTGEATGESTLVGVAEVRFPTVSDWLVPILQSMGTDYTQCVQSFESSLAAN